MSAIRGLCVVPPSSYLEGELEQQTSNNSSATAKQGGLCLCSLLLIHFLKIHSKQVTRSKRYPYRILPSDWFIWITRIILLLYKALRKPLCAPTKKRRVPPLRNKIFQEIPQISRKSTLKLPGSLVASPRWFLRCFRGSPVSLPSVRLLPPAFILPSDQ